VFTPKPKAKQALIGLAQRCIKIEQDQNPFSAFRIVPKTETCKIYLSFFSKQRTPE